MPLFDYLCLDCGEISEILVSSSDDDILCKSCSSKNIKKMLSARPSSLIPMNHQFRKSPKFGKLNGVLSPMKGFDHQIYFTFRMMEKIYSKILK